MKRLLPFTLLLCLGVALQAQNTPEIREILDRLKKLEDANRVLNDEVHSLRQELAAARSATPAERSEEQAQVEKARVDELAQSKVEASQKMPITITGMALFNTYINGRYNGGTENTSPRRSLPATPPAAARCGRVSSGLQYDSPQMVFGAKVTGAISLDLFGGSAAFAQSPDAPAHGDHLARLEQHQPSVRTGQADHFSARSHFARAGGRFAADRRRQSVAVAAAGAAGAAFPFRQ